MVLSSQPENNKDFGKLVQAYRKQRGWTQQELAVKWGYTRRVRLTNRTREASS